MEEDNNNINNLVYVFLNSSFTDSKNREDTWYAHTTLPEFYTLTYNFNKAKFKNSHFITNENKDIQDLLEDKDFKYLDQVINEKWSRYKKNPFWYNTSIRVILLCIYIKKHYLKNVTHVEADNIIFANNVSILNKIFSNGEYGFCNEGPFSSAPSFIFLKDEVAADNLLQKHIQLYEKGEHKLAPYVGYFCNYITDMPLLDIIYRYKKNYKMLPSLPFGISSENFEELQCVFDPTSYGQYIGGTNSGEAPGFTDFKHYVGRAIINKQISVNMNKAPYIMYNNKAVPIFNLHVHNKRVIKEILERCDS